MDDQLENPVVKFVKTIIMLLMAAIVVVVVWWQLNPSEDPNEDPESSTLDSPLVQVKAEPLAAEQSAEGMVIDSPDLALMGDGAAEQDSVLEVFENPDADAEPSQNAADALAQSDQLVKAKIESYSAPALELTADEHILRKFVRAVNALEDGALVNQYRPLEQPKTPFAVQAEGADWTIAQSNYERYSPYINMAETMGAPAIAQMYKEYQPLLEEAFTELGVEKSNFDSTLKNALNSLIATPELDGPMTLERPSVLYKFKDKQIESLNGAQKLMLRIGPDNRARVKDLAQAVLAELAQ